MFAAFYLGKRPIHQVSDMSQDLSGGADGGGGLKVAEVVRSAAQNFS